MSAFDAFWLPGLEERDVAGWATRGEPAASLRLPRLRPDGVRRLAERLLRARRDALAERPLAEIVHALDRAAALLEPGRPLRRELDAVLPAATRLSPPMAAAVLDRMRADWRRPALERLLRAELGDPAMLDGFRPDPRAPERSVRALGAPLCFHVFAGNVPGVAVTALVRSLLTKSAVLGKSGAGDPVLPVAFARALAEADAGLGACVAVTYWPGGDEALEAEACAAAQVVVVYGGESAVAAIRARTPAETRLVVHGPRVSCALIGRDALAAERVEPTARAAARAVAWFDQQGCVSPHVVYVEEGGETPPPEFAARLSAALDALEPELPRGSLQPGEAAQVRELRAAVEFRGHAGTAARVHGPDDLRHTVLYDPQPDFEPSCLNRTVWVKSVERLEDAVTRLAALRPYLQSVALEAAGDRRGALAESLAERAGAARITSLQALAWPPPHAHHDGAGPLRELLRFVDLEPDRAGTDP